MRRSDAAATIGVLALQGDFAAHARVVRSLGDIAVEIRRVDQLAGLSGLIIPGGESTTLLKLMARGGFDAALPEFQRAGGALFGTCAGLILLARRVTGPVQPGLDLIDIDVERNAYGRQIDSFETDAEWVSPVLTDAAAAGVPHGAGAVAGNSAKPDPLPLVFIRAPRLGRLGPGVEALVRCRGDVVLARQGRVLVASFHPEMTADTRVHRYFASLARSPRTPSLRAAAGTTTSTAIPVVK